MGVIRVAIINYCGALNSAVYGWQDMLSVANSICLQQNIDAKFVAWVAEPNALPNETDVIFIPPSLHEDTYNNPAESLIPWLVHQYSNGSQIFCNCAGVFILAATGLLNGRRATTHWGLFDKFLSAFPQVQLETSQLIVDEGNVVTAAGLMAWVDLCLELVQRFSSESIRRTLGKVLVVDTAPRQQRYYSQFSQKQDHFDEPIRRAQNHIERSMHASLTNAKLAKVAAIGVRTLQRRFLEATGFNPKDYIQRVRIQRACEILETSKIEVAEVALKVGYDDPRAFCRRFKAIMGLTPSEYRTRFSLT